MSCIGVWASSGGGLNQGLASFGIKMHHLEVRCAEGVELSVEFFVRGLPTTLDTEVC